MANLVITEANVRKRPGAVVLGRTAGFTITAGDAVEVESDDTINTTNTNNATRAAAIGIALNGASLNQPVDVLTFGDIDVGATLVVGTIYVVSTSSGKLRPSTDGASGQFVTILGVATTTSNLSVRPHASGAQIP